MTELFVTKAIVKLPRKNTITNSSNRLIIDTDYNHLTSSGKPHQQEEYDFFLVTDKLYLDGLPSSITESEIMDLVGSCDPVK